MYISGNKLIVTPMKSYWPFSIACSTAAMALFGFFVDNWSYDKLTVYTLITSGLLIAIYIAIITGLLMLILKVFMMLLGGIMKMLGLPDKIIVERFNNKTSIEVKIINNEEEKFSGELKITKIDDEVLTTPLTMPIVRGENIEPQIVIPKGESVGVSIGFFDSETGRAYFTDAYKQKMPLPPFTKIHTKLSGYLDSGEEIKKEKDWYVNYNVDGTGFSLSYLVEMSAKIIMLTSISLMDKLIKRK